MKLEISTELKLNSIEEIKKLAIQALFSDHELMNILVLKGGNALDLIYGVASRSSVDLDFSIEDDFPEKMLSGLEDKLKVLFVRTFGSQGYVPFDIKLTPKPKVISEEMKEFWGGYSIEFKVLSRQSFEEFKNDLDSARKRAIPLGYGDRKGFRIDISKFEFCEGKRPRDFEGLTIFIYSPEMIVFEKLRAICQQLPEYEKVVKSPSRSPRARDFFDIYTILENFKIDMLSEESLGLLKKIFDAKRVPVDFLNKIAETREFHRANFVAVEDTIKQDTDLKEFDFYFNYVVDSLIAKLEPLWVKKPPAF